MTINRLSTRNLNFEHSNNKLIDKVDDMVLFIEDFWYLYKYQEYQSFESNQNICLMHWINKLLLDKLMN
jgi:hypothetical protein